MHIGGTARICGVPPFFCRAEDKKFLQRMPKNVKEFHFCVIFPAKKFVLSMIICIFAALVPAEPLYNA